MYQFMSKLLWVCLDVSLKVIMTQHENNHVWVAPSTRLSLRVLEISSFPSNVKTEISIT
ncbi:hypothetical protein HanIR_Chr14g0687181 [Helianthus annuus]|nr:hypothetical protein HanIR_Chr14g0687181 [Helianthus annuus]